MDVLTSNRSRSTIDSALDAREQVLQMLGRELLIEPDDPAECIGILADRRTGKTALLVLLAIDEWLSNNTPIVSNVKLYHVPYRYMTLREMAQLKDDLHDCTIIAQELSTAADAYDFFRDAPRALSDFASQIGKQHCRLFYDDQRLNKVALRLRQQTDYFFTLEKTGIKGICRATILNADMEIVREDIPLDVRAAFGFYDSFQRVERESSDLTSDESTKKSLSKKVATSKR